MPLFRLLLTLTIAGVAIVVIVTHLPQWAMRGLGSLWLTVLIAAAVDAWRETQRGRAARIERERYALRRS